MTRPGLNGLLLEVRDYTEPTRWRWVLTESGKLLAQHEVRLDPATWQYEAFTDLLGYLSYQVAPDHRTQDEARIISDLGAWIGAEVLGPVATALADEAPATVLVMVPEEAWAVALRPLELAHVRHQSLAVQGVTLIIDQGARAARKSMTGGRLRVLGLFSLPEGSHALNLRRERYNLVRLIQRIEASGKAADVRVLQYGVTRERLRGILQETEGWDIIHISGHGAPGELILETNAGQPDRVTADDMVGLLDLAGERVALVTLSACWSAALTTAEQRRLLGLPVPEQDPDTERTGGSRLATAASGVLATELAGRLDCAVLAMRYPVNDDFAVTLSDKLYESLAEAGQPLPRAVSAALGQLAASGTPTLSVVAPALFGARAADLTLAAPVRTGPASLAASGRKMIGFPPQPDRFVGRTGVMARASAALAAESGVPGVLLHGMPGSGKTACALELAYGHEHAYDTLIWYKAPDDGLASEGTLTDFALTLERYLDGFQMAHLLAAAESLARFLPRLTDLMALSRLLIVIDNVESLIMEDGTWRDARWGEVIAALTAHAGPSRVIVTSRRIPSRLTRVRATGLQGTPAAPASEPQADVILLQVEAVDALSPDEALLLARELPHLQALIQRGLPRVSRARTLRMARAVLNLAAGHPKLLELADGQAAHLDRLAALVAVGDQAWRARGGLLPGFFAVDDATGLENGPTAAPADYWHVLAAWTGSVADALAPGERDLFWFLCCLEEPDRQWWVLAANWTSLWRRLGRDGEPPALDRALASLSATSLTGIRTAADRGDVAYALHPGVAEAGRDYADQRFRDTVDTVAAQFWAAVHQRAWEEASGGSVDTGLLVRAGLAAVPYLIRQHQWDEAGRLLEASFVRDPSRANAVAVLPTIEQITRHAPQEAGVLARVLAVIDPASAVPRLRAAMLDAAARGDYRAASANAGRLLDLCRNTGRLTEALEAAERKAGYTRQAGLGPWDQLADEVWRLQVLATMGHADQVLDEVTRLRARMAALPVTASPGEGEAPWHVREALLDTGRYAAMLAGRPDDALTFLAEVAASQRDRQAPASFIARTRYGEYFPLLHLGRTDEALTVLRECLKEFQDAGDTLMVGRAFGALADVENTRGHGDAAIRLERSSLYYKYIAQDREAIAIGYHNLGNHLAGHARQLVPAFAAHLAAAFVCVLIGNEDIAESVAAAAADLRGFGIDDVPPTDVADLCRQLGDIPGTDLPALIEQFSPDPETAERALRDLIAQAQELTEQPTGPDPGSST